ncbi:MAG: EAL domain-containing protein [Helicobacteraceae bacterium]|jgi:EAL domain-containing protein (putative c-di-GMP-specific phosphodiesterase class I)/GGDEF domain-containing protein|nr:EAL domain-containing protein [Helicobacteraceae bacterium]
MTLFKQLGLLLSLFLLTILSTVMLLEFNATIKNTKHQLYRDAQNTAASLSLSLASAKGDETLLATMINANFDTGHYRLILLEDMNGSVIFDRLQDVCKLNVPEWFVKLVDIEVPRASAPVSSGWMVIGELSVESDASQSYLILYNTFKTLLWGFAFFGSISLAVLYMLLYSILSPLRLLQEQAEAITKNEFRYQSDLPYTKEFREIVLSMNAMIRKVESSFKVGSSAMQRNRRLLYTEKLPKLYNEHYLKLKFQEEFIGSSEYDGGVLVLAEFSTLEQAQAKLGFDAAEALMIEFAALLIDKSSIVTKRLVARLTPTRFALLMSGAKEVEAKLVAQRVVENIIEKLGSDENGSACGVHIGLYAYRADEEYRTLMERALERLQIAIENDINTIAVQGNAGQNDFTQDEWQGLIDNALEKERFNYHVRNVIDTAHQTIYDRAITIVMNDEEGHEYPYGRFIAPAVKAQKVFEIYMQVIRVLVEKFSHKEKKGRYTFSMAKSLLLEHRTFASLQEAIANFDNTHELDFCIELPESFIVEEEAMAMQYVELIKSSGYRFGIAEFSAESDNIDYLEHLRPEFIKISKLFLLDMIVRSSPLLTSLKLAADALDIKIIATGVSTEEELESIQNAGVTIVQGYITEVI